MHYWHYRYAVTLNHKGLTRLTSVSGCMLCDMVSEPSVLRKQMVASIHCLYQVDHSHPAIRISEESRSMSNPSRSFCSSFRAEARSTASSPRGLNIPSNSEPPDSASVSRTKAGSRFALSAAESSELPPERARGGGEGLDRRIFWCSPQALP